MFRVRARLGAGEGAAISQDFVSPVVREMAHSAYHQLGPIGPLCPACHREVMRLNDKWHCTHCALDRDLEVGCPHCREAACAGVVP